MNGGDTDSGGIQDNPNNLPPSNSGPQPVISANSDAEDASLLSISHDQPDTTISMQSTPQVVTQPSSLATPVQTVTTPPVSQPQPADQLISQTFTSGTSTTQSIPSASDYQTQPTDPISPTQPTWPPVSTPLPPQQTTMQFPAQSPQLSDSDIIIGPPPRKKSKKGLIVGTIVLVTLVVLGVSFVIIKNTGNNSLKDLFSDFVGYLEHENSSEADLTNFDADNIYAIDNYYGRKGEERKIYFQQLDQLWQNFVQNNNDQDQEESLITKLSDNLGVVKLYVDKNIIPGEEVLKQYLKNGEEGARDYYLNYFAVEGDVSEMDKLYFLYQGDYLQSLLKMIEIYITNGCVVGDEVDEECAESKGLYDSQEYRYMTQAAYTIRKYVTDSKTQVKIVCGELIKTRINDE